MLRCLIKFNYVIDSVGQLLWEYTETLKSICLVRPDRISIIVMIIGEEPCAPPGSTRASEVLSSSLADHV